MSDSGIEVVRAAARLARLELDEEEAGRLGPQFARILDHFRALASLDVEGVEPSSGARELSDLLRPDEPRASRGVERLLAGAPLREERFFAVPKTIREEG